MMQARFYIFMLRKPVLTGLILLAMILSGMSSAMAVNRISVASGNFATASTWSPAGIPSATDQLTIQNGHTILVNTNCNAGILIINEGGKLQYTNGKKLTLNGGFLVYGTADIIEGDLEQTLQGASFKIGEKGIVTWQPFDNTLNGASLFIRSHENFHPTSTLVINKWYNYTSVPLGTVITGNFGNLTLNTLYNGLLYEWNQDNQFHYHKILGKLSIEQGWVVLDKSGAISNTEIGSIDLKNINSYLDLHSGDHPGTFTVTTNSITNIGGTMNGVYNGNGNINLVVNGDVLNLGYIELIYNSGVQNTSLGDATLKVTGKFKQTTGDFRGIFNLSSINSGKADMEFGDLEITGGIFMSNYACHTAGETATISVLGDLIVDVINANAKFRWNGLTTLSGTNCNLKLQLTIHGDLLIKGNQMAEFTSSGSTGMEHVLVKGETIIEGTNANFNYGNHATQLRFEKSLYVNGGTLYLSRTNGPLQVTILQNLQMVAGTLSVQGGSGSANITVNGRYNQAGGVMMLHNNSTESTGAVVYMTLFGDFVQQGGSLVFDNNNSSTASHKISLNGDQFTRSGNSSITTTISAMNPVYGILYFDNQGTTGHSESSSAAVIQHVKQVISSGCTLQVTAGNLQVASSSLNTNDYLMVASNAVLDLGIHQIYTNGQQPYSGLTAGDGARIRIAHPEGWYNGTANAAVKATGNMGYSLHANSIIEYYGNGSQVVTGTGTGTAQNSDNQYGVLEINKTGGSAKLQSGQIFVRTGVDLTNGELALNNYNLTILSGSPHAIKSKNGYIKSELNASPNSGQVICMNIEQGNHTIPFGVTPSTKIPFTFSPSVGLGNSFAISTRATASDNRPLPAGITNINYNGTDIARDRVIDRWYFITAPGVTADYTVSYLGDENSTSAHYANKNFSVMSWQAGKWIVTGGTGTGETTGTGNVSVSNSKNWGSLLLTANELLTPADILSFTAVPVDKIVQLTWEAKPVTTVSNYIIERSADGFTFAALFSNQAILPDGNPIQYDAVDDQPLPGTSWYRLKQINTDGSISYSNMERVDFGIPMSPGIENLTAGPNPFSSNFNINFELVMEGEIAITLYNPAGQIMYTQKAAFDAGKNTFTVYDQRQLASGIYLLTVSDGKTSKHLKLFKI
jgi:hypothetical protein